MRNYDRDDFFPGQLLRETYNELRAAKKDGSNDDEETEKKEKDDAKALTQ